MSLRLLIQAVICVCALFASGCGEQGISGPGRTRTLGYDLTLLRPRKDAAETVAAPPFHLVVAQAGATRPESSLLDRLRGSPRLFAPVSSLPAAVDLREFGSEVRQQDPERLLRLAEDLGGDMLLLVGGSVSSSSSRTRASVLDMTLVGHYVLPTNRITVDGRAVGVAISVRERRLLFTVDADATDAGLATSASRHASADTAADRLRAELLAEIGRRFARRVADLAGMSLDRPDAKHVAAASPPDGDDPYADVFVVSDGFHVGLVLPCAGDGGTTEYMEIGLGERNWAMESDRRWLNGIMAAVVENEGVAVIERVDGREIAGRPEARRTVWPVRLTKDEWGRLIEALEDDVRLQETLADFGDDGKVVETAEGYHLFRTCHDFVLNPLGRAGREMGARFPAPTPLLEKRLDRLLGEPARRR